METTAIAITKTTGFEALVERAYREQNTFAGFEGTLESAVRVHFSRMSTQNHVWKRDAFRQLLLMMYAKKCYAVLRNPSYIEVLANISAFGNKTVRDIDDWTKDSLVAEGQLKSLIRHCFAKYEVPAFMENVFSGDRKVYMLWYIQLGRGDSVQKLGAFPVKFTAKMSHEFRQTPDDYTVGQAIRRAQAIGFGAAAERAEAIAWSSLSAGFEHEDFYGTVVRFIVNVEQEVAFDVLQNVLEYIAAMRAENISFSMKGRTWEALVRQSAEWHIAMAKKREAEGRCQWTPAPVNNYVVADEDCTIKIVQLTTSEALYEEGEAMSHCVADYEEACEEGRTAIFSVRKFTQGQEGFDTLATVEVFLENMEIVQAQAKYNEMICETSHAIIGEWAFREKLAIGYEYWTQQDLADIRQANEAAEAARRAQQQANNHARIEQRQAAEPYYRPYNAYADNSGGGDGTEIVKIFLIIFKILIIVAKCSN
ncbi:PcfJ-like protein [Flavobacterium sp. AG291]|nr:PcfJ-like protein [Flavobacterium sp. AG291]